MTVYRDLLLLIVKVTGKMLPVGVWLLASNLMSFNSLDGAFEMVKGVYLGTVIDATT